MNPYLYASMAEELEKISFGPLVAAAGGLAAKALPYAMTAKTVLDTGKKIGQNIGNAGGAIQSATQAIG